MQRQAWIYTISAAVLGALDLLFRWLQCQSIFDPETGLPTPRAGLSTLVVVLLVLTVVVLWRLSGRLGPELTRPELSTGSSEAGQWPGRKGHEGPGERLRGLELRDAPTPRSGHPALARSWSPARNELGSASPCSWKDAIR